MVSIYAHRGASTERPENSMAAFQRAAELGADGIELDILRLPDGTLVVHHDEKLGRREDVDGSIYAYRRDTVQSFSIGKGFPDHRGERTPLLAQVLEWMQGNDLRLNAEIKGGTAFEAAPMEEDVLGLLDAYAMQGRCLISSFRHDVLKRIKERSDYPVGALYEATHGVDMVAYCASHGFDAIHPRLDLVGEQLVADAHGRGIAVNVWTVDVPSQIKALADLGVDSIITNDVAAATAVMANR